MKCETFEVGSFGVNCSVLVRPDGVWVVDPGAEADRLIAHFRSRDLRPTAILLTHAHFDHIGAVAGLQRVYPGLPVFLHPADRAVFTHPLNQYLPDYPACPEPANVGDCRSLLGVDVIETPGHTPGGVCYHFADERLLLSGDTLFAGSIGRTDLPGGDMRTLTESLKRLAQLPDDTRVVPGHGPVTTIGAEKNSNPFLALT